MIFRWSIWGSYKRQNAELLRCSILTFKYHFGNKHDYVVCTDNVKVTTKIIGDIASVIDFNESGKSIYNIESKATWKKWCPKVRLDIKQTEIYVDSDVFLLKYPCEIEKIIADPKIKFAILDEFFGQPWQQGSFKEKALDQTPYVNAGLFIQKKHYDISTDLEKELIWWKENISQSDQTHHDEQGALAIALTKYIVAGELSILPKDKYLLIGPNENRDLDNLESITLFHAVYPEHPAFYKFKKIIHKIITKIE